MAQDVAEVKTSHGDFGDDHLQECGESREDAELLLVETETSGSAEVSTFHDAGRNEDLRVLLVNDLETGRSFEITYGAL